jgi:protein-S-isoprenylcysteine O-methyltransferase Ste14
VTIVGIGPSIALSGGLAALVVIAGIRFLGLSVAMPPKIRAVTVYVGALLIGLGIAFWGSSILEVRRAFSAHRLVTTGVYALSRNPMYGAFIVFVAPGIALVANEWLILLVPLVAFIVFKQRIAAEEDYLAQEFGEDYQRYRTSVPQLVPFFGIRR